MWHEFLVALALVFVLEGILPFAAPELMRRMLVEAARRDDRTLRVIGLSSMIGGLSLLYLVN